MPLSPLEAEWANDRRAKLETASMKARMKLEDERDALHVKVEEMLKALEVAYEALGTVHWTDDDQMGTTYADWDVCHKASNVVYNILKREGKINE